MKELKAIEARYMRKIPKFSVGDTIRVYVKIPEGDKFRLHPFEGTVIACKSGTINAAFTVRKVSFGEGIERVFPVHSPMIDSIVLVKKGKVRRAKLYYLRGRSGKGTRIAAGAEITENSAA